MKRTAFTPGLYRLLFSAVMLVAPRFADAEEAWLFSSVPHTSPQIAGFHQCSPYVSYVPVSMQPDNWDSRWRGSYAGVFLSGGRAFG